MMGSRMEAWLRILGIVVLALGVGLGAYAATRAIGDTDFAEVVQRYERHPEHPLFQAEYYASAVRHYGLVAGAVGGILGGLVFGSLLLGIASVLARTEDSAPVAGPETQKAG
jgi:hypothetical protein